MKREQERQQPQCADARDGAAELEQVHQLALDLRGGRRQHEEVDRKQHEHGDEVDQPFEDDRGEARETGIG